MNLLFGIACIAVTFLSIHAAERLAARQHRWRKGWMWAAALLGPFPLVILLLPTGRRGARPSAN